MSEHAQQTANRLPLQFPEHLFVLSQTLFASASFPYQHPKENRKDNKLSITLQEGQQALYYSAPNTWNSLPFPVRHSPSFSSFKSSLKPSSSDSILTAEPVMILAIVEPFQCMCVFVSVYIYVCAWWAWEREGERGRACMYRCVCVCVGGGGLGRDVRRSKGKERKWLFSSLVILTPGIVLHYSLKCKILCASEEQVLC